ncbi:MAG: hypothetical protein ABIL68_10565 [bacterium]
MKKLILFTACVLIMGLSGMLFAQDNDNHDVTLVVNSIAEIAVSADVSLTVTAPTTPGGIPQDDSDNSAYLRYTSTVPASWTRNVTAAWGAGNAAPAGTQLRLQASPQSGKGTSAGQVTVSSSAQNIVTAISSCFTGTGGSDGAQLAYALEVTDATALVATESKTVTVTFTMTDAS